MALGIEEVKAALTKVKDEYAMYYNCRCDVGRYMDTCLL
jgi:hypothetical protein